MSSTAAVWDEIAGGLGAQIADDLKAMVRRYEATDDRTLQTDLGPSEIGDPCTYHLGMKILGISEEGFDDPWCRILGTATHAWLEEAAAHDNNNGGAGRWLHEARVHPHPILLPRGGNCDLYDSVRRAVIDHKVVGAESQRKYKANGPGKQYRRQAHLYGKGYHLEGRRVEHVAIAFWLRGGRLDDLYVWTEPFDETIADTTLTRYQTLRDLVLAGGPAVLPSLPRDPDCWDCKRNPSQTSETLPGLGDPTQPYATRKDPTQP